MARREWQFDLHGKLYKLALVRGLTRRRFFLNGNLLLEQKEIGNRQVSYTFEIDGSVCEVNFHNIFMEYTGYYYSCFLNDVLIPSREDRKWRRKPERGRHASQRLYWFELSKALGLKPVSLHPELGVSGKPLLGEVNSFLTMLMFGMSSENMPAVLSLIRYKPVNDTKPIQKDFAQLLSYAGVFRRASACQMESLSGDHAVFKWYFNPKKPDVEVLKQSLKEILGVLSRYTSGASSHRCENPACKNPADTNVKLALINGYPTWLCASCISELDTLGDRNKEDYENAPLNLGRGLLAGTLAAIAGSLLWMLGIVLLDTIAAAFAVFISLGIIKAMDLVKTKRTVFSILLAGLLSIGGSILGSYLGGLWITISKGGVSLSFVFESLTNFLWYLEFVWVGLWENSTLMTMTIFFSLLGVGMYLWSFLSSRRTLLKQAFKPEIHIVD